MSILDQFNLAGKQPLLRGAARYWPRHCRSAGLCRGRYYRGKRLSGTSGSAMKKRSGLGVNLPPIALIFQIAQR